MSAIVFVFYYKKKAHQDLSQHLHIMAFMLILIACVVIICKLLRIKVSATCLNVNVYRVDSIDSYGGSRESESTQKNLEPNTIIPT